MSRVLRPVTLKLAVALAASVVLVSSPARAQRSAASLTARIDSVFASFDRKDSPGCALAMDREGLPPYTRGYGMANLEDDVPIGPSTVFDIGSVSKQFTAAVVLQMAREGQLSLDDDIRSYVPELPDYGHTISLRHLLHHTSGLRDYADLMGLAGYAHSSTADQLLQMISRQKALNFTPGSDYSYSDTGYFLLKLIAERVSGKTLRDLMQERIFRPLRMESSQLLDERSAVVRHRAIGYRPRPAGGFSIDMDDWATPTGDGGVHTTVVDLLTWMHNGQRLLEPLLVRGKLNTGETVSYGFGVRISDRGGKRMFYHGGAWGGYRAAVVMLPDDSLSLAVTCNNARAPATELALAVADVVLGTLPIGSELSPSNRAGVYVDPISGGVLRVTTTGGRTIVRGAPLRSIGNGRFQVGRVGVGPVFIFRADTLESTNESPRARRFIAMASPLPISNDLAGRYRNDEIGAEWEVVFRNGKLFIRGDRVREMELVPIYKNGFVTDEYYAELGATGFTVSTSRTWRMHFERVK